MGMGIKVKHGLISIDRLPTSVGGNRGDTGVLVGDDNVSLCGAPSLHKTRETSVGLEELQQLFLHKRPLNIH